MQNITPSCILTLAATAARRNVFALRKFLHHHLSHKAYLGISIDVSISSSLRSLREIDGVSFEPQASPPLLVCYEIPTTATFYFYSRI